MLLNLGLGIRLLSEWKVKNKLLTSYTLTRMKFWLNGCNPSQGKYATRDSNGMCHFMPWQHLPEWKEEDERAFVHRGIWISNKGLDNKMPAIVNCIHMKSLKSDRRHFEKLCDGPTHAPLSTLADATVTSSGTCHCYREWHNFPVLHTIKDYLLQKPF